MIPKAIARDMLLKQMGGQQTDHSAPPCKRFGFIKEDVSLGFGVVKVAKGNLLQGQAGMKPSRVEVSYAS
jgi:hypothetical protein